MCILYKSPNPSVFWMCDSHWMQIRSHMFEMLPIIYSAVCSTRHETIKLCKMFVYRSMATPIMGYVVLLVLYYWDVLWILVALDPIENACFRCFVPDGDFFQAIRDGKADVVTDTIDTITETGMTYCAWCWIVVISPCVACNVVDICSVSPVCCWHTVLLAIKRHL